MMEIYLGYSEPDLEMALQLKEDLEAYLGVPVALENEDWEDVEDFEFQDQIHQAEVILNFETKTSNITAWLIDENKHCSRSKSPPIELVAAPNMDITTSYKAGFMTLFGLLAPVIDRNGSFCVSEEEYESDSDVSYESLTQHFRHQDSKRSLFSRSQGDSDDAIVPQKRRRQPRRVVSDNEVTPEENVSLRDLFANSKVDSERTLGRTDALKARRQSRATRKNRLQAAREYRLAAPAC